MHTEGTGLSSNSLNISGFISPLKLSKRTLNDQNQCEV